MKEVEKWAEGRKFAEEGKEASAFGQEGELKWKSITIQYKRAVGTNKKIPGLSEGYPTNIVEQVIQFLLKKTLAECVFIKQYDKGHGYISATHTLWPSLVTQIAQDLLNEQVIVTGDDCSEQNLAVQRELNVCMW